MDDPKAIGARIRQARIENGFTQVDLAAAVGVSRAHLTNVERGRGALALDKLSILARETGKTVAWLIGEGGPVDRPRAELLAAYDAMDEEQRRALLTMAKGVVRRRNTDGAVAAPRPKPRAVGCVTTVARVRGQ